MCRLCRNAFNCDRAESIKTIVIKRRVSRFVENAFYTRRRKEISKHGSEARPSGELIQAILCTLCARMHKEQANEGDVRSDETLIFGLRRCFTALCGVAPRHDFAQRKREREKKKRGSKDSRQSILNLKRVIEPDEAFWHVGDTSIEISSSFG